MVRLKNRQRPIPGGPPFYDPVTKFQSRAFASFDSVCNGWFAAIRANPGLAQQANLPATLEDVQAAVDLYYATICERKGWNDFYSGSIGGGPASVPFQSRQSLVQRLGNAAAASKILVEWISSGAEAVPSEQANARASVCDPCKFNEKGDWTRLFTVPVSEAIRGTLKKRHEFGLSTPSDPKLYVCGICCCPLKLLVHVPIEMKMKTVTADTFNALPEWCWVKKEAAENSLAPA